MSLHPRSRLRQFIGGPENSLVQVAAAATNSAKTVRYNPVFFCGPTGVGKSHLLSLLPDLTCEESDVVQSLTGSDFARAIRVATELDSLNELRTKHRNADLFILDDLQELAGKTTAQVELLQTIDERLAHELQVVIASQSSPFEIEGLISGLSSRLASGLVVPIVNPGEETRRAIVKELSDELQLNITDKSCELLVCPKKQHQRKLESVGDLRSALLELSTATEHEVHPSQVRAIVSRPVDERRFSPRQITTQAARHFQLRVIELTGPSRRRATVRARGVAIYLVRKLTGQSLEEIGRHFGQRDHSTILHSFRKTEKAKETDPVVRKSIHEIANHLGAQSRIT